MTGQNYLSISQSSGTSLKLALAIVLKDIFDRVRPNFPSAAQQAAQVQEFRVNLGGCGGFPPCPPVCS